MIAPLRIALFATVTIGLMASLLARTEANPLPKQTPPAAKVVKIKTDTRVYLMRGLLNVFSLGMDTLSERLNDMGIESEVSNHNGWMAIANKIAEDRKRGHSGAVVVIGHSLGADVMFQLTERLEKQNIPVRLAVFFDPTISGDISTNVEHVLNLYQLNGFGRKVTAPKGYKGELVNMDLSGDDSIGHGSIDKSPKLHDLVVAKIMKVAIGPAPRKRQAPVKPKPVATAAPPTATAGDRPSAAPASAVSPATKPDVVPAPRSSSAEGPSAVAPASAAPPAAAPAAAPPAAPSAPVSPAPVEGGPQVPRI